jgi:hypothetical protein
MALRKARIILLLGMEGVILNREIFPLPIFGNGPTEFYET